jgi:hypothetical protein
MTVPSIMAPHPPPTSTPHPTSPATRPLPHLAAPPLTDAATRPIPHPSAPALTDPAAPRPTPLPTPRPGRGRALRGFLRPYRGSLSLASGLILVETLLDWRGRGR